MFVVVVVCSTSTAQDKSFQIRDCCAAATSHGWPRIFQELAINAPAKIHSTEEARDASHGGVRPCSSSDVPFASIATQGFKVD